MNRAIFYFHHLSPISGTLQCKQKITGPNFELKEDKRGIGIEEDLYVKEVPKESGSYWFQTYCSFS
jgi:hypothetical protein